MQPLVQHDRRCYWVNDFDSVFNVRLIGAMLERMACIWKLEEALLSLHITRVQLSRVSAPAVLEGFHSLLEALEKLWKTGL